MSLPNDKIALVNDSKISIYNDRLLLDYEIDLLKIKKNEINLYDYEIDPLKIKKNEMNINNIYQMKNGNIICSCKEGDIFIFEKKKKQYNLINTISMKEEIYKLGEFFENYICLLSKNHIKIYDSTFSEDVLSYKNDKTFANFCTFSNKGLALAKNGIITINNFENKYINFDNDKIKLERGGLMDTLVGTDKYLIIGGMGKIYFYDVTKNYELESKKLPLHPIINYISKIHDQFLLASTNKGSILQLVIKENGTKEIIEKYITNKEISYILMVNYEMIAISGSDGMDILSISHKEETENNKNCTIF
jgi:WD40 repeat protein